jgi:hypothetical protein
MLILVSCLILFLTSIVIVILRAARPEFRFGWLAASGGALLALLTVFFWQGQMPLNVSLPVWRVSSLLAEAISLRGDGLTWPFAISLSALALAILLTGVARPAFNNSFALAGVLSLTGLGLVAATAANPLTLLFIWAALDITELVIQLASVDQPYASERVVIAFSARTLGSGLLLWANIVDVSAGGALDFLSASPQAGLYLIAAAGLRLGVFPLHLPYSAESSLRRGFGTALRMTSAASSLVLLGHIPAESLDSPFTPFLLILTTIAAIYGGWMWLRAPDELAGRPFWIIAMAALAISASLRANPIGAVAWSCALIVIGGVILLSSAQQKWISRSAVLGAWGLSTLPYSLTASAWQTADARYGFFLPFLIAAQSLLIAGFIRHALRPAGRDSLDSQTAQSRFIYSAGIVLLLTIQFLLGVFGWDGAFQFGNWIAAIIASFLTFGLLWASPRLRLLNPVRAHWVTPASWWVDGVYRSFWGTYKFLGRISRAIVATLEGDGGIMWTLLFLVLFISLLIQGRP